MKNRFIILQALFVTKLVEQRFKKKKIAKK